MKKPTPLKDSSTHPWVLEKPYSDPRPFKTLEDARRAMVQELGRTREAYRKLNASEDVARIDEITEAVRQLGPDGGEIDMVADLRTGLRYRATVRRRT